MSQTVDASHSHYYIKRETGPAVATFLKNLILLKKKENIIPFSNDI
jgi:hypothetical protein